MLTITGLKELQSNVNFAAGQNQPHGLIYVRSKGKLYAACHSRHAIRFDDPSDLTQQTVFDLASVGFGLNYAPDVIYVSANNKVYISGGVTGPTAKIAEIDPEAWTGSLAITGPDGQGSGASLASDGTYLYVLLNFTSKVLKYLLSDYSLVDTIDLGALGMTNGHALRISGTKLFATGDATTSYIARIDLSAFTVDECVNINPYAWITDDFCFWGNYIFLGLESAAAAASGQNILRLQKDALTTQLIIDTGITTHCYGTYFDGAYVWAVFNASPGKVLVMNPSTLTFSSFTLSAGSTSNEIVSDELGRLFVTFYSSPGAISQISPLYSAPFPAFKRVA